MSLAARAATSSSLEVRAVVGRRAAELDGELHAGAGAELVGVQAQPEPGRAAGEQHGPALVGVERAALAERVDPAGVRGDGGEHRAAHERRRSRRRRRRRRHDVGAEERDLVGRHDGGEAHEPRLVVDGRAVAGLDLDRRDAGPAGLGEPPGRAARAAASSVAARRRLDRHVDAAGGVRRAGHAGRELGAAVAGEHEVGVAVDEPRDHARPADVDALVGGRRPAACRPRPRPRRRPRRGRRGARRRRCS